MQKAIFLDRDGTLNEEMGYINHASRFKVFDYTFKAIRILNNSGFLVFVITNQSGLARGYFDEDLLSDIHNRFIEDAKKEDAIIEQVYFCPHHKDGVIKKYKKDCDCRKPKPGMLLKARDEYNLSLENSFMIGDRYKDIQFGQKNNLSTIMVLSGYGLGEFTYQRKSWDKHPDFICKNVLEAAMLIEKIETSEL
ncbi:MAG: HAD family hydrolase [Calditrichaeota bacterium]|nr:HAD family hydrolase [Calditrichota bacterium]